MRLCSRAMRFAVVFLLGGKSLLAQQEPNQKTLPDAPVAKQAPPAPKHDSPLQATFEILGRRSIFFPDLATSPGPLNTKEKFELFAGKSIAPSRFLSSALGASLGQARDSLPAYGQEMGGYGKRLGSSIATGASTEFFSTFLFSSLLHRDPRYFVLLRGGPWHRVSYGLSRLVVARTDSGKAAVNWPGTIGPLFAESLANSYLPVSEQTASRTFQRYGIRLGFTASTNILKEYWPTIFRSLRMQRIAPGLSPVSLSTSEQNPRATLR
jgi:hypothetical protein